MSSLDDDRLFSKYELPAVFFVGLIIGLGIMSGMEHLFPRVDFSWVAVGFPLLWCLILATKRYLKSKATNHKYISTEEQIAPTVGKWSVFMYIAKAIFVSGMLTVLFSIAIEWVTYGGANPSINQFKYRPHYILQNDYLSIHTAAFLGSLIFALRYIYKAIAAYKILNKEKQKNEVKF
jgi:hypothetical protein